MSGALDKKSDSSSADSAAAAATPAPMTIAPFMGNNQALIAEQLAAGFGGTPQSYIDSPLMQLFQPMTIPNYAAGAPLVPSSSSSGKSSGSSVKSSNSSMSLIDQIMEERRLAEAGGRLVSKVSARPA